MPLLILVVIVIIAGVAIALRSSAPAAPGSPADQAQAASARVRRGPTAGLWCLVCGLLAAAGVALIGQATFGWVAALDPPGWLRVVTFWMLPAGEAAAAILGALSLKRGSGRPLGIAGLVLAGLAAAGFFAMLASVDY